MCLPVKTTAEILLNLKAEMTIVWSIFCKSCELVIGYGYMLSEQQTHGQRRFDFKRRKYSFPSPHPLHAILMFELPTEHNKHPNFEWGGGGEDRGGVQIVLFSEVTLFEYNVSKILSPIAVREIKYIFNYQSIPFSYDIRAYATTS